MTTMTKIESLWQALRERTESVTTESGGIRLLRLDPEYPYSIFAGVDDSGNSLLAIGVDSLPPNISIKPQSFDYFRQQRAGGSWLMVLRLIRSDLDQVFGHLCQDLVDAAASVPSQAMLIKLFIERLILWQKLFQQGNSGCLESYQIKGLMAELLSLEHLLMEKSSAMAEITMAWTGPLGADQDFIFGDRAIEIKATSPSADKVSISSVEQLESLVPMELWIYVLKESAKGEQDCICLIELTTKIEGLLSKCTEGLMIFKERLLAAGYIEQDFYKSACFSVMDYNKYSISAGFPRLIRTELPLGISDISYSISLSTIDPFKIKPRVSHAN
jgi:hypothetical protein